MFVAFFIISSTVSYGWMTTIYFFPLSIVNSEYLPDFPNTKRISTCFSTYITSLLIFLAAAKSIGLTSVPLPFYNMNIYFYSNHFDRKEPVTMKRLLTVKGISPDTDSITANLELPSKCPRCNVSCLLEPLDTYFINHTQGRLTRDAYSLFFCPNCEECFVTTHTVELIPRNANSNIREIFPASSSVSSFSNQISALSPNFVRYTINPRKLKLLAAMKFVTGYRKALEFLSKIMPAVHTEKETDCQSFFSV